MIDPYGGIRTASLLQAIVFGDASTTQAGLALFRSTPLQSIPTILAAPVFFAVGKAGTQAERDQLIKYFQVSFHSLFPFA
jgi:hypothetical protein